MSVICRWVSTGGRHRAELAAQVYAARYSQNNGGFNTAVRKMHEYKRYGWMPAHGFGIFFHTKGGIKIPPAWRQFFYISFFLVFSFPLLPSSFFFPFLYLFPLFSLPFVLVLLLFPLFLPLFFSLPFSLFPLWDSKQIKNNQSVEPFRISQSSRLYTDKFFPMDKTVISKHSDHYAEFSRFSCRICSGILYSVLSLSHLLFFSLFFPAVWVRSMNLLILFACKMTEQGGFCL